MHLRFRLYNLHIWFSPKHWGLINFGWGRGAKWALHLAVSNRANWYWGTFEEQNPLLSYWGLGPLGCVSRINYPELDGSVS
jgi:hypothetical protein